MQDGQTKIVEVKVECPKCHQENLVRVDTGNEVDTVRQSVVCAHCQNRWTEFLPGQTIGEPYTNVREKHRIC